MNLDARRAAAANAFRRVIRMRDAARLQASMMRHDLVNGEDVSGQALLQAEAYLHALEGLFARAAFNLQRFTD